MTRLVAWLSRWFARTEELDLGPMRQRESFVTVMDRNTRSPK